MILFNEVGIEVIYLAEITKVEFSSAVWKNCRKNEIDLFLTSDNLLSEISQIEGLPTK